MKTYFKPIQQNWQLQTLAKQRLIPFMVVPIQTILVFLGALTTATAIVLLSVWMAGVEISNIIGAGTWGLGFIYLGLAVDNHKPTAIFQLATGIALLVLAWLQHTVSPDFTIVSGVLLATWVLSGFSGNYDNADGNV